MRARRLRRMMSKCAHLNQPHISAFAQYLAELWGGLIEAGGRRHALGRFAAVEAAVRAVYPGGKQHSFSRFAALRKKLQEAVADGADLYVLQACAEVLQSSGAEGSQYRSLIDLLERRGLSQTLLDLRYELDQGCVDAGLRKLPLDSHFLRIYVLATDRLIHFDRISSRGLRTLVRAYLMTNRLISVPAGLVFDSEGSAPGESRSRRGRPRGRKARKRNPGVNVNALLRASWLIERTSEQLELLEGKGRAARFETRPLRVDPADDRFKKMWLLGTLLVALGSVRTSR